MAISQLARDPSGLSRLASAIGGGLGSGLQQGIEGKVLEDILSKQDFTEDPQAFIQALLGSGISQEGLQQGLTGAQFVQQSQKQQQKQQQQQQLMDILGLGGGEGQGQQISDVLSQISQQQPQQQRQENPDAINPQETLREPVQTLQLPKKKWTDQQVSAATLTDSNVGKMMQAQNDAVLKTIETKSKQHTPVSNKYIESVNERAEVLPQKENAMLSMQRAIKDNNLGYWSLDNLANITGNEGLRTPGGAEFITSGKEYFLGSLKRAGARPNQWIEQQIQKMLPQIGRSRKANLTVAKALEVENKIERKQIELTHDIANQLEDVYGYVPRDLAARVAKQMRPFAEEQQKLLAKSLKEIQSGGGDDQLPTPSQGKKLSDLGKVTPGTPISKEIAGQIMTEAGGDKEKAREIARGLGYEF